MQPFRNNLHGEVQEGDGGNEGEEDHEQPDTRSLKLHDKYLKTKYILFYQESGSKVTRESVAAESMALIKRQRELLGK